MAGRRSSRALGPEALLAHRDWIEQVAHALVLGDADADDLGQQVWVDVLERPPAENPTHLRSWLRSVLRFMSIDAIRASTTRRRHEEAAAHRERIDVDPADVVARAETLDRVAHAVLGLD
ncbi:MAG TPA: sigma factor, partial [Planctomycetota bacterium]|nr:sigma factor [Planctomycetota bacterium]